MAKTSKASKTAEARRARVEELQRAQRAKERRRVLIAVGAVGVVIAAVAVVLVVALTGGGGGAAVGPNFAGLNAANQIIPAGVSGGATTTQKMPASVPNPTDIKGVLAWDTKGYPAQGTADAGTITHDHVLGPVKYAITPPVGGPHNAIWMNAGVYTKPIPSERAVHNMEHGAVWITYNPNLPRSQIQQLVDFVKKQSLIDEPADQTNPNQSNRYIDLSPWADDSLPTPIVISSWGYQLRVNNPSDSRLQQFVDTFRFSKTYTPEYGPEVDGIPVETGGRAAGFGSSQANPPGVYTG